MFYSLPTEDPWGQNRFIRTEDLIEGIQSFYLVDVMEPEKSSNLLDAQYPFKLCIRVYLQTIDEKDTITLYFSTKENRDKGINIMLRDLWNLATFPAKDEDDAEDRESVVCKPQPVGDVPNKH